MFASGSRRWMIGSEKPAVLPVPVCAAPITSRPSSTTGIALAWIGVGVVYPCSAMALRMSAWRPNWSKVTVLGVVAVSDMVAFAKNALGRNRLRVAKGGRPGVRSNSLAASSAAAGAAEGIRMKAEPRRPAQDPLWSLVLPEIGRHAAGSSRRKHPPERPVL
ncbi:hypothetical protein BN2476_240223 [Paraburkholderia piptadeniae]|uniref:Uncharacterized protein n=1 Tax=Paraburkholderia piptadeniae TaxID=1701573 RepID=A0A1N7RZP8_9BURK|nr:hypothetical protein BN2476_240223 [Paraburkholderia piptadeniae]